MKTVTAREANHGFSEILSQVEQGAEVLITKRGRPVAVLAPYKPPAMTPAREAAIKAAIAMMKKGLDWGPDFKMPTRDEIYDR